MRCVCLVAPILACLVLGSCATTVLQGYEGPARPDAETALIYTKRASTQTVGTRLGSVNIVSIRLPHGILTTNSRSARVLPGERCIEVQARSSSVSPVTAELCFWAYAGSIYEIRVLVAGMERELEYAEDGWLIVESGPSTVTRIWMVDAATSEVVAVFTP